MKKQSKLTFASMLTAAGAMICLTNCVNTPAGSVYGAPPAPMPGTYEQTDGDESQEFSEVRFIEEKTMKKSLFTGLKQISRVPIFLLYRNLFLT